MRAITSHVEDWLQARTRYRSSCAYRAESMLDGQDRPPIREEGPIDYELQRPQDRPGPREKEREQRQQRQSSKHLTAPSPRHRCRSRRRQRGHRARCERVRGKPETCVRDVAVTAPRPEPSRPTERDNEDDKKQHGRRNVSLVGGEHRHDSAQPSSGTLRRPVIGATFATSLLPQRDLSDRHRFIE